MLILLLLALTFAQKPYPVGHDSLQHFQNAIAVSYVAQHPQLETLPILRSLEFHWPPLVYAVTAALLQTMRSVWAFHLTNLLFAACFMVFFLLAARQLTTGWWTALMALMIVCACPCWMTVALSYNLESAQLAATAFLWWLLLSGRYRRPAWAAPLWGLAAGLALLSKTVIFVQVLLPILVVLIINFYRDRQEKRNLLAGLSFLAAFGVVAGFWYGPIIEKLPHELAINLVDPGASLAHPWYFHLRLLLLDYAALPALLTVLIAAPLAQWKEMPKRALLPLLGAVPALLFFSQLDIKWEWYALGAFALAVLSAAAVLDRLPPKIRNFVLPLLLGWYTLLALIPWFPNGDGFARLMALGSSDTVYLMEKRTYDNEAFFAEQLRRTVGAADLGDVAVVDVTNRDWLGVVEMHLTLHCDTVWRHPYLASYRLWERLYPQEERFFLDAERYPMRGGLRRPIAALVDDLPRSRFVVTLEKFDSPISAFDTLAVGGLFKEQPASFAPLQPVLADLSPRLVERLRLPLEDLTLVIRENPSVAALRAPEPPPIDLIAYLQLIDPTRHARYLEQTEQLMYAGRITPAVERFRFYLDMEWTPKLMYAWEGNYTKAMLDFARCLRLIAPPAQEAAELIARLTEFPKTPNLYSQLLPRLMELTTVESNDDQFLAATAAILAQLPPEDYARRVVVGQRLLFYLARNDEAAGVAFLQRESAAVPPAPQAALLTYLADKLASALTGEIAREVYRQALAQPLIDETAKQKIRLLLAATGEKETLSQNLPRGPFADDEQALLAARLTTKASVDLRRAGRTADALALIESYAPDFSACAPCADELRLEKIRCLLALQQSDSAREAFKEMRDDQLRSIALELLHQAP